MTEITFVRMRPAGTVGERWAATRRREGATTVEGAVLTDGDVAVALAAGLLPVVGAGGSRHAAAFVAGPGEGLELAAAGIPGWRITITGGGDRAATIDALARTGAAFLRVGRSGVAVATSIAELPGIRPRISVFVDTVEEALVAIEEGASDLLLRAWDTESLGQLRDVSPSPIVERTALPIRLPIDDARAHLEPDLFAAYLDLIDASGSVRPRTDWAVGKSVPAPHPPGRVSAQWNDEAWSRAAHAGGGDPVGAELRRILERSLDGIPPDRDEVQRLFEARGAEVEEIASVADTIRERTNGDVVSFVVNRNINYTNRCSYRCGFCAFSKGSQSSDLREAPYLLTVPEIVARAVEAWDRGATEVCLQGGIPPEFTGAFYLEVLEAIRDALPDVHIHGFTPLEVWQGAATLDVSVRDYLRQLREAGLNSLPGTAAEILDDRIRRRLCPDKVRTAEWADVIVNAHRLGLRSTATMMFGHVDDPSSWANHVEVLREIQRSTGGFTEFVPLPFIHMGAPMYVRGESRPGPTWDEVVLAHAVPRIAFDGLIDHVQVSWVKLGLESSLTLLGAGANDLGGTLMGELISAAAGAAHGTEMSADRLVPAIESIGRIPFQRNTLYDPASTPPPRWEVW